ncbi:MAG: TIGR03905 family TSCPD domain-containing protein [Eubacterium sp.]|nr:TIGR03905 family TSCPD domain-containing protein [Eubacterium sp.]
MHYQYKTKGTCSQLIEFDLEDGILSNVRFQGGCNGNLSGISRLAEGRRADEVADLLKGTRCGFKNTSCPDQFSKAILSALQAATDQSGE